MKQKYDLLKFTLPSDWSIKNNNLYSIQSNGEADKCDYLQEDLLWIQKGQYNIDVGWYWEESANDDRTGYCIYLYRGDSWNNSELLEKFRSRDIKIIENRIYDIVEAVENGKFDNLVGYLVNENDKEHNNDFNDIDSYFLRTVE